MAVETQILKLTDVGGGQQFTGSITPAYTSNISARVNGRVADLKVKVGDRVTMGQVLAQIDTTALQQSLEQSQSTAAVNQAQYNKAVDDQANTLASAQKALALQKAQYDKTVSDQQNTVAAAKQAVATAQATLNNTITSQQNTIATAKQGVSTNQTSLSSTQSAYQIAVTNAQNALNAAVDNLLTSQNNTVQSAQLQVDVDLQNYATALKSGTQTAIDSAYKTLQKDQLALQQAQEAQYKDAQSAQASAQSNLVSLQNTLASAQASQAVQVAQEQLNAALTTLANAQAAAQTAIESSQQTLNAQQLAYANSLAASQSASAVAQAQLEQAQLTAKNAESTNAVLVSQAQLEQAKTNVKVISEQLQDGTLNSPVEGVVTSVLVPVGQYASAQTSIVGIASVNPLLATVNVSESSINKIKQDAAMTVSVPTLKKNYEGKVYAVHPTMDSTTKSYAVDIKVEDPNHELLPGMFAVTSLKSEGRQAIMVPADAVLSQPSGNAVFIVQDGKAKKVSVKIGQMTSAAFEITEGLKAGDELVVKGQELLSDNVPVQKPGQAGAANGQNGQSGQAGQNGKSGQNGQSGQSGGPSSPNPQSGSTSSPNGQSGQNGPNGQGGKNGNRQNGQSGQSGQSGGTSSPAASPDTAKAGAGQ